MAPFLDRMLVHGWADPEVAAFGLGIVLGLWEDTEPAWRENRGRFEGNDPLGAALIRLVRALAAADRIAARGVAPDGTASDDGIDEQYLWETFPGSEGCVVSDTVKAALAAYVKELRERTSETSGGGEPGKGLVTWQIADELEDRFDLPREPTPEELAEVKRKAAEIVCECGRCG